MRPRLSINALTVQVPIIARGCVPNDLPN